MFQVSFFAGRKANKAGKFQFTGKISSHVVAANNAEAAVWAAKKMVGVSNRLNSSEYAAASSIDHVYACQETFDDAWQIAFVSEVPEHE